MSPCPHWDADEVPEDAHLRCGTCLNEKRLRQDERTAILTLIEETAKSWKDGGDPHQMIEVVLARIRARN